MRTFSRHYLGAALAYLALQATAADYGQGLADQAGPVTLENADNQNAHWSGIGRMSAGCIGTLIDTRDPWTDNNGPAYIITNGHCANAKNGTITHDQPITGTIAFNYFADTASKRQVVALKRLVWSSIQGVDLALLELDAPLRAVMETGIVPLKIDPPTPVGSPILVVGDPINPGLGLRLSTCTMQKADAHVERPWVWRNILRNQCAGMDDGASGSPILNRANNNIVGLINSTSFRSYRPSASEGQNYGVPITRLFRCGMGGRADLTLDGCDLLPGFALEQQNPNAFQRVHKIATAEDGSPQVPSWNYEFIIDTQFYRYKTTRDALQCENPAHYSDTLPGPRAKIEDTVGPEPGRHFLCIVGVESPEQSASRALMANSMSVAVDLFEQAPVPEPSVLIEPRRSGDIKVTWTLDPPHLDTYRAKRGPIASTDCADERGYTTFFGNRSVVFKANKLPQKLCTYSQDIIKQRSPVRTDLLPAPAAG